MHKLDEVPVVAVTMMFVVLVFLILLPAYRSITRDKKEAKLRTSLLPKKKEEGQNV